MLSSFTTRFHNFIWFLIFTFTLYTMPCLETLLPYEINLSFPEAEAAEAQQEATSSKTPEQDPTFDGTYKPDSSDSSAPSATEGAAAAGSDTTESKSLDTPTTSLKVDEFTGAAHLSYPIVVPPGRSGLSPQLSISYSSTGGNGWLGVGWDLPVGYIQRRGPRKAVPKYNDTTDVYELNLGGSSQELVPIGGDEYRLRIEGALLKIKYKSDEKCWEVWDKSGTKMTFGSAVASRIGTEKDPDAKEKIYRWCLDRVQDPRTNYMELIYWKDEEEIQGVTVTYQIYLQEIKYNGQDSGGLQHNHRVLFNLEGSIRPDPIFNYRGGFKMWTRKRLSTVEVWTKVMTTEVLVRKYLLEYKEPYSDLTRYNVRSMLSQITLYGNDGASSLPPVKFTYQALDNSLGSINKGFANVVEPEGNWPNFSAWSNVNGNYIQNTSHQGLGIYTDVIDMNGDALPDRVVFAKDDPYDIWTVFFNNGAGFDETGTNWPNPSYFDQWDHVNGNYIKNTSRWGYGTYTDVIDMDGDGLSDRVVFGKDCSPPFETNCPWTVYFNNNGNGFQEQEDPNWPNPSAWHRIHGNYIKNTSTIGLGTYTHVIDMNGDGLPDRVVYNKDCSNPPEIPCPWTVYFNNGAGFGGPEDWPNPSAWSNINGNYIQNTSNLKFGTYTHLIDMNGDGLPDRVVFNKDCTPPYGTNCPWTVYFNIGKGFDQGVSWSNPSAWHPVEGNYIQNTSTIKLGTYTDVIDMNGDGLPDRVVFDKEDPYDTWTVYFNNGSGFGPLVGVDWPNPSFWSNINGNYIQNTSNIDLGTYTNVMDMNGDGLPDRVVFNKDCTPPNCPWSVYFNKGPFADLLSKVDNGIGGTIEISYLPSTAYEDAGGNKVNKIPFVVQTVNSYIEKDGRDNSYTHKYFYSGASYDSVEVEFRGFRQVMAYQMFDAETYESMTDTTFHQDYYKKGKIERQTALSKITEGHRKDIANTWAVAETLGGGGFPYLDTATTTVTDQGAGGPFYFSQTTKNIYDIRSSDLAKQTFNLLQEHKNEGSPEEIVTLLEYPEDPPNGIVSKPIKVTVTNGAGLIASRKWMDYNNEGDLTIEELCKSDTPNTGGCDNRNPTQNVMIYYQYDQTYKVLNQVTDPRLYLTTITYDSTKTFVYETSKCVSQPNVVPGPSCTNTHATTSEFDPSTGNVTKLVPAHLQGTIYWLQTQYDAFGRKKLERMKDNSNPEIPPNLDMGSTTYTYNDTEHWVLKTGRIVIENVPGRTLTLNGTTYYDGLGRTYFAMTNGPDGRTIAIETHFDNVGRVWKQSNPYFTDETKYFTEFYYDGFSRLKDTLKTDTYYIHTDYEGLRKVVSKQVTPSEWQTTAYIYDLNQKLVKVAEGFELPGQETFTHYTYDTLGNLTQVRAAKDASGNDIYEPITTTMTYDSLMKKKSMSDPDMGGWTYDYDKAGNLITQTDAKGQTISFDYNDGLNRLTQKTYVNKTPAERVVCTYDDPAVPYSKGKVTKISRLAGSSPDEVEVAADFVLAYDRMQRVETSKKKIKSEEGPDIEKTFAKSYDSSGRVVSVTYPGNRTYSYEYDVPGNLLYVKDDSSGNRLVEYSIFTALGQHKFATFPKPNNVSVKTSYEYYPETGRIRTLKTEKLVNGDSETFQNLKYQKIDENPGYDGVGNITVLQDLLNNITHNFTYDHLNRLTQAYGAGTNSYNEIYQYDLIGNITYKSDVGTYNYSYSSKPHAVNSTTGPPLNINLQYDNNGNMIQRAVSEGTTLDITYDYDNKPNLIKRNTIDHVKFTYDGNGQRVKKYNYATSQSVLYFGDLYETRGGVETIHVFAGGKRLASVFLDGTTQFYHTNHLGSSSVVTDQYGGRKEQIEYFPFGVYRAVGHVNGTYDWDPNFPDVFYTFTGQEDDDDLGLYNYGARLYDPVLGRFISPDGIVQAPDDPQTLNRYSYARNNPLIYTDPSGNFFGIIESIVAALSSYLVTSLGVTAGVTAYTAAATITYTTISVVGGAALGAATSAATGGDIGMGALTGAISGLIFYGAGNIIPGISGALGATGSRLAETAVKVAVHTVAGGISGGINSAITGSNIGLGMLTGAVGAGIGAVGGGALTLLKVDQFGYQLVARVVSGGIAGGVVSEIYGGNFWQGFAQGAKTAAIAFLFNGELHKRLWLVLQGSAEFAIGVGFGGSGTAYIRNDPIKGYASVDDNTGLGAGKGFGMGLAYTDNPDKIAQSLNVCWVGCISVLFSKDSWVPVGGIISIGGYGAWWSEPIRGGSVHGEWKYWE